MLKYKMIIIDIIICLILISSVESAEVNIPETKSTNSHKLIDAEVKIDSLLNIIHEVSNKIYILSDSLNSNNDLLKKINNYPFLEINREKEAFFHEIEKNRKEYAHWFISLILAVFGFLIAINYWKVDKKLKSLTELESTITLLNNDLRKNENVLKESTKNLELLKDKVSYESLKSEFKFYYDTASKSNGEFSVLMSFYSLKLFFDLSKSNLFHKKDNLDIYIVKAILDVTLSKLKKNRKEITKKFIDPFLVNYCKSNKENPCRESIDKIYHFLLSLGIENEKKDKII